jgi:hypothetical protein
LHWLKEYTDKIRAHLSAGDAMSLTYAALEARLALERVCYERLRISHKYISRNDLRTWKPQHVVRTVMDLVDPAIASEWVLQIGSEPGDNPPKFIPVGTQKGFDPKYISQLWQAMSSFLHCEMPKGEADSIEHYLPEGRLRPKIEEVLKELDRIAAGTIVGAMVFQQVSFECACGQHNGRSAVALKHDDIIGCIKEGCKEQFRVERIADEFEFERRLIPISCYNCGQAMDFPIGR